jgi:hypothetical protein
MGHTDNTKFYYYWDYHHDVERSSHSSQFRKAEINFCHNPDLPGLRLKPLQGNRNRWSIRPAAGIRTIIWNPEPRCWIYERAGNRSDVYDWANRVRPTFNWRDKAVRWVDPHDLDSENGVEGEEPRVGHLFFHWSDQNLRDMGEFNDQQIADLRTCAEETDVYRFSPDFNPDTDWTRDEIDYALELLGKDPEAAWELRLQEDPLSAYVRAGNAIEDLSPAFSGNEIKELGWSQAPIEDWMIFLHPDQRECVEYQASGPLLVKGAAGTGKSVVGYHRALLLEKRHREAGNPLRVLVTTFNKPFSLTQQELMKRLSQRSISQSETNSLIDIRTIDSLAYQICSNAGINASVGNWETAFKRAYRASPLSDRYTQQYLQDEVLLLIKGRGLTQFEEYAEIDRLGRKVPFRRETRRQVWALYEA